MVTVDEITLYVDENIVHSKLYDSATPEIRNKAVNQSINTLYRYMADTFISKESIAVEDVTEQVIWLLRIDDSMQRAEMGTTSINIDGMQIQMSQMDRTIAPNLLKLYGVSDIRRRKVGSYVSAKQDTFRRGNYFNDPRRF